MNKYKDKRSPCRYHVLWLKSQSVLIRIGSGSNPISFVKAHKNIRAGICYVLFHLHLLQYIILELFSHLLNRVLLDLVHRIHFLDLHLLEEQLLPDLLILHKQSARFAANRGLWVLELVNALLLTSLDNVIIPVDIVIRDCTSNCI